jgi:hypothetical protein
MHTVLYRLQTRGFLFDLILILLRISISASDTSTVFKHQRESVYQRGIITIPLIVNTFRNLEKNKGPYSSQN